MEYNLDNFTKRLAEYNLFLSERQLEQFRIYYELLVQKNQVMNLTTITKWGDVVEKHFLDSLAIAPMLNGLLDTVAEDGFCPEFRAIDVGTGAGFPGIPLKIAFPELAITLSDSLQKRVFFLEEVVRVLDLENISAIHSRAENLSRDLDHREKYNLAVSRAVANLSTLSEYCLPFVKEGGRFIAYKSGDCDEEVAAAEYAVGLLGGRICEVKKFQLGEAGRSFVVIEKEKSTPKKYPRKAGTPAKNPL